MLINNEYFKFHILENYIHFDIYYLYLYINWYINSFMLIDLTFFFMR